MDAHVNMFSNVIQSPEIGSDDVIARLDEAGVEKAVVSSSAFLTRFSNDQLVLSENNFISEEVSQFPDRLVGLCAIIPQYISAPGEVTRCLNQTGMVGVTLDLGASHVNMTNADHIQDVTDVFARTQQAGAPLLLAATGSAAGNTLSAEGFGNLVNIIVAHPNVRVAIANCGGYGDSQGPSKWLSVMNNPAVQLNEDNLFLEASTCLTFFDDAPFSTRENIVWQLRAWGLDRVMIGSNYRTTAPEGETPASMLEALTQFPFTQEEVDQLTSNDASLWFTGAASQPEQPQ
jgi:predicted TIM-barrel fold metal-dependent hydrolase